MARVVPAVERALDILELFAETETLSIPEVRERLDLPRSSVHELMQTLVSRSYLRPVDEARNRFQLGVAAFLLGARYAERIDLVTEAQRTADEVSAECGETTQVAVLDGTEVVYVAKVDSTRPVRLVSAVGRRLPAHCTAIGKALLAALDDDVLDERYPPGAELVPLTANSITDPARLREQLVQVRQRGIAFDDCESNEAVCCVAASVHDRSGEAVAAMSISVPELWWNEARRVELSELVRDGAAAMSRRLGHQVDAASTTG